MNITFTTFLVGLDNVSMSPSKNTNPCVYCLNILLSIHTQQGPQPSQCKMKLRSSIVVIICCLLVQLVNLRHFNIQILGTTMKARDVLYSVQGIAFLSYPLLGHLADVYLTRYRALKCGFVILIGSILYIALYTVANAVAYSVFDSFVLNGKLPVASVVIPSFILLIVGIGLFEANAIQFGLDQLLEAPTSKLITFIHWYYWSQSVGQLIISYTIASAGAILAVLSNIQKLYHTFVACFSVLVTITSSATLVLYCIKKKHFYIQRAGLNPFKNIYNVLKYSWKHKVPEHRSAFTYWEEDIPRRIDLGKNKYGGPFTNEEVEDTKTFLRILPLLLCLFGYHLAGNVNSAPIQLQRTSCPSLPVLLLIVYNPQHLTALVTVVGIPLYRLVIIKVIPKVKTVRMLTKMWVGLYLSLLQVAICIIVVVNNDTTYWLHHSHAASDIKPYLQDNVICFNLKTGHDPLNQTDVNETVDNTYLWFIIPQLLNGLSSLLVSMTVFEFICAQAPRTTQGLFIGLWYATFSIRYLVVGILDILITERRSWLIYEGVKGFLILVSLVLFSCVSRCYRYRQRDEIVNVQGMIEDTHERWLDQEEEYMEERRAFYQIHNAYSVTS